MLVCKLEMWPERDPALSYPLGEVRIVQNGGDEEIAHYRAELDKASRTARKPGVWRTGQITNFHRLAQGPYDLLLRALIACVGGRSHAALRTMPNASFGAPVSESEVV